MPAQGQQQACMESKKSHGRNPSPPPHPFALLSFFKVMIGDFSQALFLPPIVAKKLSSLLNQNVDIEDSNGHRWGVKVSLVDNHLAFEQGWQDFVLDHSIKVGEFVILNHVDRLLFSAKIYAITGCERLEFVDKSFSSKSKGERKNEASADDISLKRCQSVGKLDKDVVDSNEGLIKRKQTTKSAPGDTSDGRMVTRSRKAGVKHKGDDVNALGTSHVRCEGSKRPKIEIVEPVVSLDEMVDKTCQTSPAGPVNMDVDVMTMTNGDNSSNVGDSISEGMSQDFVWEEQMPDVKLAQVPVKRDSVFTKRNIAVSSPDMIVSEAEGKSCDAVETDTLVTSAKSSHGSLNEIEADYGRIVDTLIRNGVLTGDSPQGVVAGSSVNLIASKAKGNLCSAIESDTLLINEELSPHRHLSPVNCQALLTSDFDENGSQNENAIVDPTDGVLKGETPQENVAVASVSSLPTEAIGNSCDVQKTTNELAPNEERKCTGHGSRNETEANCEIAVDPLISGNKVLAGDLPQGRSTSEGIKIKLEDRKTESSESFDDDVIEGNLNASDGVHKFLGTLQGICYIVKEEFTDKFGGDIVNLIDLCDADEGDFLHKTDGTFNEDKSRNISLTVPLDKVSQHEEELGSLGEGNIHIYRSKSVPCLQTVPQSGKIPVVSLEENEKKLNPSSEISAHKDVQTECLMIGKKPVGLLEENEKKSSLSSEVTLHEDLKPECIDLLELPSSSSFIFEFRLPSNNDSWLKLPNSIPYSFGKMFLLRKVLVLQDPVMRKWPVLYCENRRFTGFIGGWKDFTAANDLKEGDTCELYLADKENHTFLVRIKKAENPAP